MLAAGTSPDGLNQRERFLDIFAGLDEIATALFNASEALKRSGGVVPVFNRAKQDQGLVVIVERFRGICQQVISPTDVVEDYRLQLFILYSDLQRQRFLMIFKGLGRLI